MSRAVRAQILDLFHACGLSEADIEERVLLSDAPRDRGHVMDGSAKGRD
jgi:hypothetical protein